MKKRTTILLQQILGGLYILAGIGKFIPQLESVEIVLIESSIANKNNWLAIPSQWMAENYIFMTWWIGIAMIVAGTILLLNHYFVRVALLGTLIMIACFMLFLYKSEPKIFIVDIPFIALAIFLLQKKIKTNQT